MMMVLLLWLPLIFGGQLPSTPTCSTPIVVETETGGISAMECVR